MHPPLGIIEGFFGPAWSWHQRQAVMRTLAQHHFSFYVYAPKSDRLLRRDWQTPLTEQWQSEVQLFASACAQNKVDFGVGITPFDLHKNLSAEALASWRKKIRSLVQLGVRTIAILFDDMNAQIERLVPIQMQIIEAAQAELTNQRVIVCPSYYSSDIILDRVFGQRPANYLSDLGRAVDPSVDIFWTGEEVCSRQFAIADIHRITEQLKRKPLLWDNYPVNDGPRMSQFLHLRGFTGRPASIGPLIAGHAVNPALQPMLSIIPALTLASSYRLGDAYVYSDAFVDAARVLIGESSDGQALVQCLREDLLALQDIGLDRLGERRQQLQARYKPFDHPAAHEVLAWLDGHYAVSSETVQTQ